MAVFNISVPDELVPKIAEAFSAQYGWVDDGVTRSTSELLTLQIEFARQQVISYVTQVVTGHEIQKATKAAAEAAAAATSGFKLT